MANKPDDGRQQFDGKAAELSRQLFTQFHRGTAAIKKKVEDISAVQEVKTKIDDLTGTGMTEEQMAETKPDEWKDHVKSQGALTMGGKVKDAGALIGMATLVFPPAAIVAGALVAAGSAVIAHEKTNAEREMAEEHGAELNPKGRFIRNALKAFIGSNS